MTSDQMKSAADELRARANMNIGTAMGHRCLAFAKMLEAMAECKPAAYVHELDLKAVAGSGVAQACVLGSKPLAGMVAVYTAPPATA